MHAFQSIAKRHLLDLALELHLDPCDIPDSGNGTEYKNYDSKTIFTVYHERLDDRNVLGLELALGIDNATAEIGIDPEQGLAWLEDVIHHCPQALSKSPKWWPRIAVHSDKDVGYFASALRELYATPFKDPKLSPLGDNQLASSQTPGSIDERLLVSIQTRRGQARFRASLIQAYGGMCAVTGCADTPVLEAAHIVPHAVDEDYRLTNGLLLRTDIHTLFDLQLLSVDPSSGTIVVSNSLGPVYSGLHGAALRLPVSPHEYPDGAALMQHYKAWKLRASSAA